MTTLHRPRPTRGARPLTDHLERTGGITLVVAAAALAAGLATAMRLVLPS